jgi:hypothetical protein
MNKRVCACNDLKQLTVKDTEKYVPVRTWGNFAHDGTYRYVLVCTVMRKITPSTYRYVL